MGNGNKVFTVSYGTFSCTLEGFTEKGVFDSMGAMKAIAEYFRDLASDERYFAANASGLDANVISGLASRNSSQKVTARTHDTKVVLSPAQPEPTGSSAPSPKACPQETPLTERARRIRALANQGSINEDENEQTMVVPIGEVIVAAPVENFSLISIGSHRALKQSLRRSRHPRLQRDQHIENPMQGSIKA